MRLSICFALTLLACAIPEEEADPLVGDWAGTCEPAWGLSPLELTATLEPGVDPDEYRGPGMLTNPNNSFPVDIRAQRNPEDDRVGLVASWKVHSDHPSDYEVLTVWFYGRQEGDRISGWCDRPDSDDFLHCLLGCDVLGEADALTLEGSFDLEKVKKH